MHDVDHPPRAGKWSAKIQIGIVIRSLGTFAKLYRYRYQNISAQMRFLRGIFSNTKMNHSIFDSKNTIVMRMPHPASSVTTCSSRFTGLKPETRILISSMFLCTNLKEQKSAHCYNNCYMSIVQVWHCHSTLFPTQQPVEIVTERPTKEPTIATNPPTDRPTRKRPAEPGQAPAPFTE